MSDPCAPEAFEARYRADPDPWRFATSHAEQARYDEVVRSLPDRRIASAYEPGCSVGVLTRRLAERCDRVRAIDVAPSAVAEARRRCANEAGVTLEVASVTDDDTAGHDLVVLSEIGYYFAGAALTGLVDRVVAMMTPDATLVACHWLGRSEDHRVHGSVVHHRLDRHPQLQHRSHRDGPSHVIDVWVRI